MLWEELSGGCCQDWGRLVLPLAPGAVDGVQSKGRLPQVRWGGNWQQRPILQGLKETQSPSNFPSLDAPRCFPFQAARDTWLIRVRFEET